MLRLHADIHEKKEKQEREKEKWKQNRARRNEENFSTFHCDVYYFYVFMKFSYCGNSILKSLIKYERQPEYSRHIERIDESWKDEEKCHEDVKLDYAGECAVYANWMALANISSCEENFVDELSLTGIKVLYLWVTGALT